jgi:hypothetical protein
LLDLDVWKGIGVRGTITTGETFDFIAIGGKEYANGGAYAKLLKAAGKPEGSWVEIPESTRFLTGSSFGTSYDFYRVVDCIIRSGGTLSRRTSAIVDGAQAQEIVDAGDVPGSTPASYFITLVAPTELIRVDVHGERRPGGQLSANCRSLLGNTSGQPIPSSSALSGSHPAPWAISFVFSSPRHAVSVIAPSDVYQQAALAPGITFDPYDPNP